MAVFAKFKENFITKCHRLKIERQYTLTETGSQWANSFSVEEYIIFILRYILVLPSNCRIFLILYTQNCMIPNINPKLSISYIVHLKLWTFLELKHTDQLKNYNYQHGKNVTNFWYSKIPRLLAKFQISLTKFRIPWLFPDLEIFSFFPDFSLTVGTLSWW